MADAALLDAGAKAMEMDAESFAVQFSRVELRDNIDKWRYHPALGFGKFREKTDDRLSL